MRFLSAILFLIAVVVIAPVNSSAYTGGLLDGKTLNAGSGIDVINTTTTLVTDNDENTTFYNNSSSTSSLWYRFSEPVVINSYMVDSGNSLYEVRFYGENKNLLASYSYDPAHDKGEVKVIPTISDVYYVELKNTSSLGRRVAEFDVFEPDTTPPSEVTNLNASDPENDGTVKLTWNNPTDYDFSHINLYKNGSYLGKYTNQSALRTYNVGDVFTVKTVDNKGNESDGVSVDTSDIIDLSPPDEITDFSATSTHDKIYLEFTNPPDDDFSSAKIYVDGVYHGETSEGAYVVEELSPETTYRIKITTVDIAGNESSGVSLDVETKEEPPPKIEGDKLESSDDKYVVSWDKPTTGQVKIIVNDEEYDIVNADLQVYEVPKSDVDLDIWGNPKIKIVAISESGKESSPKSPDGSSGKSPIDMFNPPFDVTDLLKTSFSLLLIFGPLLLLSLAIYYYRPILNILKRAVTHFSERGF